MGVVTEIRKPAIRAKIIDDNLNSWIDLAGADINMDIAYHPTNTVDETDQTWWGYRGQGAMCLKADGSAIVRVRLGDGTDPDRQLYIQTITDPTDPTQWTTWSTLYSGTHYAVAIEPDAGAANGYRVYHAKSDGIYRDNVKKITVPNVIRIKPVAFPHAPGFIYFQTTVADTGDGYRAVKWFYTTNVAAGSPTFYEDCANFRWYKSDLIAFHTGDDSNNTGGWARFRALPAEGRQRDRAASDILFWESGSSSDDETNQATYNLYDRVRYLRGPSEQAGFKTTFNLTITKLPTTEFGNIYFLFYTETHQDIYTNTLSNLKQPLFWQSSASDPYYLSAPTPVGYSVWGFAGAVAFGDYIYIAGNGRVLSRYWPSQEIDITDYIKTVNYEIPRGNEKATGRLVCANPINVIGSSLGLNSDNPTGTTDQKLHLEIGRQLSNQDVIQWKRDSAWWTSVLRKIDTLDSQNLEIDFHNFWGRLENPFRDLYYMPGHISWSDWMNGGVNHLPNWFNTNGDVLTRLYNLPPDDGWYYAQPALLTTVTSVPSITLFTGWQGENGHIDVNMMSDNAGVVFRYKDTKNYMYLWPAGTALQVRQVIDGNDTLVTQTTGGNQWVSVNHNFVIDYAWERIRVWNNHVQVIDYLVPNPSVDLRGFTGVINKGTPTSIIIGAYLLYDFNVDITTQELIRILLAHIGESNIEIASEIEDNSEVTVSWGPQTDLDTPFKALQQLVEASKLETVWLADG